MILPRFQFVYQLLFEEFKKKHLYLVAVHAHF